MSRYRTPGQPVSLNDEEILLLRQNVVALMQKEIASRTAGWCFLDGLEWGLALMAQAPWIGTEILEAMCTMRVSALEHESDWHHRMRAATARARLIQTIATYLSSGR